MTKIVVGNNLIDINLDDYYIDVQNEHIYFSNRDDIISTKRNINDFFNELISRQRGDEKDETAIQAVMTVSNDKFAAKIAENNGLDPHQITDNNLIRFLCNERNFYKSNANLKYAIFKALLSDNEKQMLYENLNVRILSSEDTLKVYCTVNESILLSDYQLDVIQFIGDTLKELAKNNPDIDIQMGVYARKNNIVFEGTFYLDSTYKTLTNYINDAKEECEKGKTI